MISFKITEELTKSLKKISDLTSQKSLFLDSLDPTLKEAIHAYARISTIGASTRIENAILTDPEIAWMDERLKKEGHTTAFLKEKQYIENKLSKEKARSIEEVAGARNMMTLIYKQAKQLFPLSEVTIRGLHKELLQFYPPAAHYLGAYKKVPNNVVEKVGNEIKRTVLKTADPGPITTTAMHDLIEWYNKALPDYPWSVAVAVEFIFRFLAIHPFQDGNGRLGRALFLLSLLQSPDENLAKAIPYCAIDRHIEKHKEEYYLVLRQCSGGKFCSNPKKYKIEYFLAFMLKMMDQSLRNDIDFYAKKYQSFLELSDTSQKVLNCFKEFAEKKLGTKEIIAYTEMPRRTIIKATQILLEKGFLQKHGKGAATQYQLTF